MTLMTGHRTTLKKQKQTCLPHPGCEWNFVTSRLQILGDDRESQPKPSILPRASILGGGGIDPTDFPFQRNQQKRWQAKTVKSEVGTKIIRWISLKRRASVGLLVGNSGCCIYCSRKMTQMLHVECWLYQPDGSLVSIDFPWHFGIIL